LHVIPDIPSAFYKKCFNDKLITVVHNKSWQIIAYFVWHYEAATMLHLTRLATVSTPETWVPCLSLDLWWQKWRWIRLFSEFFCSSLQIIIPSLRHLIHHRLHELYVSPDQAACNSALGPKLRASSLMRHFTGLGVKAV
jgi:hypothetical protein